MGDAASELANGLHFLTLCKLYFQASLRRRIDYMDKQAPGIRVFTGNSANVEACCPLCRAK